MKRLHFIAIGGAAMHNLAIALKNKGYKVTGSDDEVFEPSLSRLRNLGLLPEKLGWDANCITADIDGIILGMHARNNNPELLRAQELGLKIYSYPEYLYEQTKNKKRIVIAGSHGKTTITAMVIHVLTQSKIKFDFMVGSQIDGFDTMVALSDDTRIAVFEGDEYLSSPLDLRPKFIHYKPHIALISGIAWDHINVFPTFENYLEQFRILTRIIEKEGHLIYFEGDTHLQEIVKSAPVTLQLHAYTEHINKIDNGKTCLIDKQGNSIPIKIFGRHNLQNLNGARIVCNQVGISDEMFYKGISSFPGTAKRLQVLKQTPDSVVFLDFAHSPSKVMATVKAVREQFPNHKLIAVFELHTFSSLTYNFIPQYAGSLDGADVPIVVFSEEVLAHKKLPILPVEYVKECFANSGLRVVNRKEDLLQFLTGIELRDTVLLLMSSGNFVGIDVKQLFC